MTARPHKVPVQNSVITGHKNKEVEIMIYVNIILKQTVCIYTDRQGDPYVQLGVFLFQYTYNFITLGQLIEVKLDNLGPNNTDNPFTKH